MPAPHAEPAKCAGIDLDVVRQAEQLRVNAVVKLARVLARSTRQVRPADRADEQRVAGQHEPRLWAATQILTRRHMLSGV